jgi:hypothetical protein
MAADYVPELGQFVKAVMTQEPSDAGDARIVPQLEHHTVTVITASSAELPQPRFGIDHH